MHLRICTVSLLLICLVCAVRSDWLLTKPCNDSSVASYGTYTNSDCTKQFGFSTYGKCNNGQSWSTFTCRDKSNCRDPSCKQANELPMGKCLNGAYYTCTDTPKVDAGSLEWPAVAFEMYGSNTCAQDPVEVYIAKRKECINYPSQGSKYLSYKVACHNDGWDLSTMMISFYAQEDCVGLQMWTEMGANNCTTLPDFFYDTPLKVKCSTDKY